MRSDEELRRVLGRPDLPWPDETGAYERFLRRRVRHRRVVAATAGLALVAVLGVAVLVARQLPQERAPAPPAAAAEPTPRPHQWVYEKELRVEDRSRKPWTWERWVRVDGKKTASASNNDLREARVSDMRQLQLPQWSRCPPAKREQLARIRPAAGLARWFPNPAAVPTDPDGLLAAIYQLVEDPACAPIMVGDTVQDRAFILIDGMFQSWLPAEVRVALYQALAKIPQVMVVQGATDAAGRRGVAFVRAAAIEGPGSSDWLRLEIILDPGTHRYLGARHVVTRDHHIPNVGGPGGTRFRKGQVLVSRAQVALAVVDAPCQRPGQTTTCAS